MVTNIETDPITASNRLKLYSRSELNRVIFTCDLNTKSTRNVETLLETDITVCDIRDLHEHF